MDYTKMNIKCPNCNAIMKGFGGQFGGRITIVNVKCYSCETQLMVVPLREGYEYKVSATTENERKGKVEIIKQFENMFDLAGIKIENSWILVNRYNGNENSPWLLIKTKYGMIEIGNRKRVISISWTETKLRSVISEDDVTKEETFIHAWTNAKAVEYLSSLKEKLELL